MNRRTLVVVAVVALMTASAHAADPARAKELALPQTETSLRALFDRAPGVIVENENGLTAGPSAVGVIVARIDTDGNLVKACVDTEAAARRFLEAPIERVDGRRAKEH